MKGIIAAFSTLINMIKMLFSIIMGIFETIAMVFRYLITIVNLVFTTIATLPSWLSSFAIITVAITIAYFLIGRNVGKSD